MNGLDDLVTDCSRKQLEAPPMNSHNNIMWGSPDVYLFERVGGLAQSERSVAWCSFSAFDSQIPLGLDDEMEFHIVNAQN